MSSGDGRPGGSAQGSRCQSPLSGSARGGSVVVVISPGARISRERRGAASGHSERAGLVAGGNGAKLGNTQAIGLLEAVEVDTAGVALRQPGHLAKVRLQAPRCAVDPIEFEVETAQHRIGADHPLNERQRRGLAPGRRLRGNARGDAYNEDDCDCSPHLAHRGQSARSSARRSRVECSKLDRLSRNAAFLLTLRDSGVRFVAADMPEANDLSVGIRALVDEQEREAISRRTKEALAAARAGGVRLGNHPTAPLRSGGLDGAVRRPGRPSRAMPPVARPKMGVIGLAAGACRGTTHTRSTFAMRVCPPHGRKAREGTMAEKDKTMSTEEAIDKIWELAKAIDTC